MIKNILLLTLLVNVSLYAEGEMFTLESEDLLEMSFIDLMDVEISSADKTAVPIRDIPASVTIVTRSEIEKYGYTTLPQILRNIPGLYMMDDTEQLHLGVRGNSGGGLQFLVNGVAMHPSNAMKLTSTDINKYNIPVGAIDRIEVVRGPMSVMYGNNAFFGIVNIITNDSSNEGGLMSASYGSRDSAELFARYAKKYKDGFFVINAGVSRTEGLDGDYADMLSPSQLSTLHPASVSSMDGEVPHQRGSIGISAKYKDFSANASYRKTDFGFYPTMPGLGGDNHIEMTTIQTSLAYNTALTDTLDLKILGIFSEEEYYIPTLSFVMPTADGKQRQNSRRKEFEANLVHKQDYFEILSGYRYLSMDNISNDVYFTTQPNEPFIDNELYVDDIVTHELFTQLSYKFTESLSITGGLRYLRLPDSYNATFIEYGIKRNAEYRVDDRNQLTGRLAVLYKISPYQNLKFLAGTAAYENISLKTDEPEKITTYEINYLVTHDDFKISSSLFYNNIEAISQEYHNVAGKEGQTTSYVSHNDGKWKSYGLELIANYHVTKNFNINGSLTLQDTKNDVHNGVEVEYSPKVLAKLMMDYRYENFVYALNSSYVSGMKTSYSYDVQNDEAIRIGDDVDSYFLLGANVRHNHNSGVYTNLNISNLLDEEYRYATRGVNNMQKGLIGMGRVVMVTIGYKF